MVHLQRDAGTRHQDGSVTHEEIFQQPELWRTTFDAAAQFRPALPNNEGIVIVTGAGTSAFAADAIASSWPNARAVPTTDLLIESREEIETRSPDFLRSGLLISVARSGNSPESVAVIERINRMSSRVAHLVITCNADGRLAKMPGVQALVLDPRTNDRGLAMTSSFSNLVLAGLCLRHGSELAPVLPAICEQVQRQLPELDSTARKLANRNPQRVVCLANRSMRALAVEACLKVLEMTAGRTVTLSETFLGVRHGPLSFLTEDSLVMCFVSASAHRRLYEADLVQELRSKNLGTLVGIGTEKTMPDLFDTWIPSYSEGLRDELRIPFDIPFAQLLAFHLSVQQGLDPDNPSPAGIITRTVQRFAIHNE